MRSRYLQAMVVEGGAVHRLYNAVPKAYTQDMPDTELQAALRAAIIDALNAFIGGVRTREETRLMWRRRGDGSSWDGSYESVRTLAFDWDRGIDWQQRAHALAMILQRHHPDHVGLVGTAIGGQMQLSGAEALRLSVAALIGPVLSPEVPAAAIDAIVTDVGYFLTNDRIRMRFVAPLLNFRGPTGARLNLPGGYEVRVLTDDEVTELYGGSVYSPKLYTFNRMNEWAVVGELDVPKLRPGDDPMADDSLSSLQQRLNSIVLGLRTFKSGSVGYDAVIVTPLRYIPIPSGTVTRTFGQEYVPIGTYSVAANELDSLIAHIGNVTRPQHSAMRIAASRLAACEIRLDAKDRLIDAVIGLEAILLAHIGNDRGELSFRFSLNYALLQDETARANAFKTARTLYDLRSRIAHGGAAPQTVKLDGADLSFEAAATRAAEILREILKQYLPNAPSLPAADGVYWQQLYLS